MNEFEIVRIQDEYQVSFNEPPPKDSTVTIETEVDGTITARVGATSSVTRQMDPVDWYIQLAKRNGLPEPLDYQRTLLRLLWQTREKMDRAVVPSIQKRIELAYSYGHGPTMEFQARLFEEVRDVAYLQNMMNVMYVNGAFRR